MQLSWASTKRICQASLKSEHAFENGLIGQLEAKRTNLDFKLADHRRAPQ